MVGVISVLFLATPAQAGVVSAAPDAAPTFNGTVWATAYAGDTVYVGGDFTAATAGGASVGRNRLAAFDARTGALRSWAPSADGRVRAIATAGGSVYIAGEFGQVSGVRRDNLARLDAVTGAVRGGLVHDVFGQPYALAAGNGRLYVGGSISAVDGQRRSRLAAFEESTGALDADWRPAADGTVQALAVAGDRVYVGGKFTGRLAARHPTTGAADPTFRPRAGDEVRALAVAGSGVYAAHGGPGGRVVAYGLDGGGRWNLTMDGDPQAITVLDGVVYFGGHFDKVCSSPRTGNKGSCLDGSIRRVKLAAAMASDGALLSWTANGNGSSGVHTLANTASLGKLGAGGAFTAINGKPRAHFAQFTSAG